MKTTILGAGGIGFLEAIPNLTSSMIETLLQLLIAGCTLYLQFKKPKKDANT